MKLLELHQYDAVDVEVTRLYLALGAHHLDELKIPRAYLSALLLVDVVAGEEELLDALRRDACSTDEILYLPHIEQIFRDILFALLLCNDHRGGRLLLLEE